MLKKTDLLRLAALIVTLITVLIVIRLSVPLLTRPVIIPTLMQLPSATANTAIEAAAVPTNVPEEQSAFVDASLVANRAAQPEASTETNSAPATPIPASSATAALIGSPAAVAVTDKSLPTALPFPT